MSKPFSLLSGWCILDYSCVSFVFKKSKCIPASTSHLDEEWVGFAFVTAPHPSVYYPTATSHLLPPRPHLSHSCSPSASSRDARRPSEGWLSTPYTRRPWKRCSLTESQAPPCPSPSMLGPCTWVSGVHTYMTLKLRSSFIPSFGFSSPFLLFTSLYVTLLKLLFTAQETIQVHK